MSKSNYSRDGNYFVTLQQTSPTASLPNLPDHAGIGMNVNAAGTLVQACNMECFSFTLSVCGPVPLRVRVSRYSDCIPWNDSDIVPEQGVFALDSPQPHSPRRR
jgi:hypothetical protein